MLVAVVVILMQVGCGTVGWSVTPYAGVGGNTDNGDLNWNTGVSVTLFNRVPGYPAVPNFYLNDSDINTYVNQVVQQGQGSGDMGGGGGNGDGGGGNGDGGGDGGGNVDKGGHGYGDKNHDHQHKND